MTLPEMIIFDYGHTLIYEPYFNEERGTEAVLKYAVRNANNLSAKEVCAYQNKLFLDISKKSRSIGLEIHNQKFQNLLYDYLDINIPLAPVEIEHIFWDNAAPGIIMQNADKMLDYINKKGIRSSVISNISFSGEALAERINRLFPDNRFEFIIASSEYVYRKPNPVLFELAVKKARLSPDKVWFCGDSTVTDVSGASAAGIFPVWYQSRLECIYRDKSEDVKPECEHMHIRDWEELIDILEKL
jgi:putative hydrolase of the HAD superfamily